jgi:hypothetical protein
MGSKSWEESSTPTALVDIETAQQALHRSRRAVFYYVKRGLLTPRSVKGSKKLWFELSEVTRLAEIHKTPRGPQMPASLRALLSKYHPRALE